MSPAVTQRLHDDVLLMIPKIEENLREQGIELTERERAIAKAIIALCIGYSVSMTMSLVGVR